MLVLPIAQYPPLVPPQVHSAMRTENVIGGWTAARTVSGQGNGTAVLENGTECVGSFSDWDTCEWDCNGVSDCPAEPAL